MHAEFIWFYAACALYLSAAALSVVEHARGRTRQVLPTWVLAAAVAANSVSILLRWARLDHGPYVDLWETLSSSVWGYHAALLLAVAFIPRIRPILPTVLPILAVMVVWNLVIEPRDARMPVTYDTPWLPLHIMLGKVFIGCVIVAMGLMLARAIRSRVEARGAGRSPWTFPSLPSGAALEELAFRFMLVAFVFDTLMLVVGALWAQDAWGRYWAWDPLEVWSFLTWVAGAFYLHLRVLWRPGPVLGAALVALVFVLAFLTYFGIPFLSKAAHQGVV